LPELSLDYDLVIVGAGVVGLAVAAAAASSTTSVLVLERHDGICRETSSRHSEVIHAGIYYPPGSRKATSCVRGRKLLYERCERLGIDAPKVGKYIVALDQRQVEALGELAQRGAENGVDDLLLVGPSQLAAPLPGVAARAALWSPSTGVVDSHAYAASFQAEAEAAGADIVFHTEVLGVDPIPGGYRLLCAAPGGGPETQRHPVTCRQVVNAAGLGQDRLSQLAGIDIDAAGYRQFPCKGDYFRIAPRHRGRAKSLIYPVGTASAAGLGVHICLDTAGGMRLGPDATWVDGPPYPLAVDAGRRRAFFLAGRALLPWLEEGDLEPDQAGIRAKLSAPGGGFRDFVVAEESDRGLAGWITLAGIESPGLTAAAALAEEVAALLD
jgi:L-2-hydroxyglutarate oxidase LhgO